MMADIGILHGAYDAPYLIVLGKAVVHRLHRFPQIKQSIALFRVVTIWVMLTTLITA
jgi:hypothetical protein